MVMSLRVQVMNVRFFGKGAIFAGNPLDTHGKPAGESIVVRAPQSALGAQVLFQGHSVLIAIAEVSSISMCYG
jgi:hypothetical protein